MNLIDENQRLDLNTLEGAIIGRLRDPETGETRRDVSEDDVRGHMDVLSSILAPGATAEQLDELLRTIVAHIGADIPPPGGPLVKDHKPWLEKAKPSITWRRWYAYRRMLSKNGISPKVLLSLDKFTDDILDLIGDPKNPGRWNRRGLIIGDVQSGKTQNFIGIMNKAADAGYRLIIVLSGNTEYLRRQTHERVDAGFIGRDTSLVDLPNQVLVHRDNRVGVGIGNDGVSDVLSMTTVPMDYLQHSKKAVSAPLPSAESTQPVVFVIKKNLHVLRAVEGWAAANANVHGKIDLPVLVLDDESDYASVNTGNEDDPTAINGAIRRILARFNRSSYVAITATPFANIFIDHEAEKVFDPEDGTAYPDLFPEDYVYPLEAPTNYSGIFSIFGLPGEAGPQGLVSLTDAEKWIPVKHRKDQKPGLVPESLRDAIRTFIIANAIMDLRVKAPRRRSMLINASRFVDVQGRIFDQVLEIFERYKMAIDLHSEAYARGEGSSTLDELHDTFVRRFAHTSVTWPAVLAALPGAVASMRPKVYNSRIDKDGEDELYEDSVPTRQIAIGGDLLSRGLTLDGLVVSYFHRRVAAADTMMQMARWFGYRDGYRDLCHLWIGESMADDYRFVGSAVMELRNDLANMKKYNMTPQDFGLAVRKHPEALLITARNKQKSAISAPKSVNLLGQMLESTKLANNLAIAEENFKLTSNFADSLAAHVASGKVTRGLTPREYPLFESVPKEAIADFLRSFSLPPVESRFDVKVLADMAKASAGERFDTWDVVFMNGAPTAEPVPLGESLEVRETRRSVSRRETESRRGEARQAALWVSGKRSRLAGPDDLARLLDSETQTKIVEDYVNRHPEVADEGKVSVPEHAIYPYLTRAKLMIYVLNPTATSFEGEEYLPEEFRGQHLVALKVALPSDPRDIKSGNGKAVYLINTVAQRQWTIEYEDFA
ncbi:Z1 domain-containing protein [Sinomonas halotolerans]|uniref:Z1 domain-containing protein n=1 Tax=Sinomonas halotolerans TaxID=1644133 RepID=A0ABU9X1T7_9MICC